MWVLALCQLPEKKLETLHFSWYFCYNSLISAVVHKIYISFRKTLIQQDSQVLPVTASCSRCVTRFIYVYFLVEVHLLLFFSLHGPQYLLGGRAWWGKEGWLWEGWERVGRWYPGREETYFYRPQTPSCLRSCLGHTYYILHSLFLIRKILL